MGTVIGVGVVSRMRWGNQGGLWRSYQPECCGWEKYGGGKEREEEKGKHEEVKCFGGGGGKWLDNKKGGEQ